MAVNKNFVVKNGLEVNTNLIVADTDAQNVGIGTTISRYLLHVNQGTGIGASSVYVTGISTVAQEFNVGLGGSIFTVLGNAEGTAGIGQSVGVGTGEPAYLLDVRAPVSTGQTALYVQGDMRVTGDINLDDIRLDQLQVSGVSTFIGLSTFASGITVLGLGATTTTLNVSGVSTFSDDILIGTGATVGFGSTAYFRDNAKVILGDSEDLQIYHDGSTSFIKDVGTGILAITSNGGHIALMNSAQTENMAKFVVDGAVELYHNGAIKLETTSSGVDVTGTFNSTGITTLASGGGITTTGGDLYVGGDLFVTDNITLDTNLNILGIATIGTLDVTGDVTIDGTVDGADGHKSLVVGTGLSVHGPSAGVAVTLAGAGGITTTGGDFYVGGDLYISEDVILDTNLEIIGIATIGTLDVSGTSSINTIDSTVQSSSKDTGALVIEGGVGIEKNLFVGGGAEVTGITTITGTLDANGALDVDGHTELDDVNVAGASTFTGAADFNGAVDIDGHTELDDVNVSGASTFTGAADFNGDIDVDGHTELDNLNVAGFSTFVGFATFSDYVFVQDGLNVAGIITATSFDGLGQIGVGSEGTFIGVGITMVDFKSSNEGNTVDVDGTSGIATVTVTTGVSLGLAIALGG